MNCLGSAFFKIKTTVQNLISPIASAATAAINSDEVNVIVLTEFSAPVAGGIKTVSSGACCALAFTANNTDSHNELEPPILLLITIILLISEKGIVPAERFIFVL
jgi:hypothetical protein